MAYRSIAHVQEKIVSKMKLFSHLKQCCYDLCHYNRFTPDEPTRSHRKSSGADALSQPLVSHPDTQGFFG